MRQSLFLAISLVNSNEKIIKSMSKNMHSIRVYFQHKVDFLSEI